CELRGLVVQKERALGENIDAWMVRVAACGLPGFTCILTVDADKTYAKHDLIGPRGRCAGRAGAVDFPAPARRRDKVDRVRHLQRVWKHHRIPEATAHASVIAADTDSLKIDTYQV
ncbi:MAG: hypothetical protein ACK55Z_26005, partial [bacterium]